MIAVYDVLGRQVAVLSDEVVSGGMHETIWNGRDADGSVPASGVYLYKIIAGKHTAQGKVMFLR